MADRQLLAERTEGAAPWLIGIGAAGLVALGFAWAADPAAALRALLAGWFIWIGVPAGCMVLLFIHALIGGEWGEAARPVLAPAAATLPLAALAVVPILFGLDQVYPWVGEALEPQRALVGELYLNWPAFALRAVAILAVWSVLAIVAAAADGPSVRAAAIGLILYGLTISFAAFDWAMSLAPKWHSTILGALVALSQITSGLAFLVLMRAGAPSGHLTANLAALLLALTLGTTYFGFMQYLVIWAGNLPHQAEWYIARGEGGWGGVIAASVLIGVAVPFFGLMLRRVRESSALSAMFAACVLLGLLLHGVWLTAPSFTPPPGWPLWAAVASLGLLWLGLARGAAGRRLSALRGRPDG